MSIRINYLLGIFLFCVSFSATAAAPSYNYAEVSFVTGEADEDDLGDIDQDGFRIDASYALENNLWFFASYAHTDGDEDFFINAPGIFRGDVNVDVDIDTIQAGIGIILEPDGAENTSVDFSVRYRQDDFDADVSVPNVGSASGGDDAEGFGFIGGIRHNINDMFELTGRAGILTSDYDNSPTYELGAVWNIGEHFAASAAYEFVDIDDDDFATELSEFRVGARVKF